MISYRITPANLTITSLSESGISLRWQNNAGITKSYLIAESINDSSFASVDSTGANINSLKIAGPIFTNTKYAFRVHTENGNYLSDYPQQLSVQFKFSGGYTVAHVLTGHTNQVGDVAFAAKDKIIVSSSSDRTLKLWYTGTGHLMRTMHLRSSGFAEPPAMAAHDNLIDVSDIQNSINIYDVYSGNLLKTLKTYDGNLVTGISFSPDGKYLGAVNTGYLTVWRVSDWSVVMEKEGDLQYSVSFSSDDKYVVSGSTLSGNATVYNLSSKNISATLSPGGYYVIWAVAFSPNNNHIAIGGLSGDVLVFPATGGKILERNYYGGSINAIVYSPIGNLIAAGGNMNKIKIWKEGSLVTTISEQGQIYGLAFSHDARYLVSGDFNHNVYLYKANGSWSGSQ